MVYTETYVISGLGKSSKNFTVLSGYEQTFWNYMFNMIIKNCRYYCKKNKIIRKDNCAITIDYYLCLIFT